MPNPDPQNVYILQDFPTGLAVEQALKKAEVSVSEAEVETKLEAKQDVLNTTQMAAVNSGITADKVTEIINTVTEVQTIVIEKIPPGQDLDYATNIDVTIDNTNYQITFQLKDQNNNNLGTAQTIDLPIESLVMKVEYDAVNDALVITLQNGTKTSIPVSSITSGLQPAITNANKLSADLVDDSATTNKFINAAQANKIVEAVNKVKTVDLENVSGLKIENGTGSDKVITHTNDVTPETTGAFNKVLYDAHGHVTGATPVIASDVTGLVSGNNLTLANYTKPVSTSAVEPTDTVNQAIGKLEKAVESAGDNSKIYSGTSAYWVAQPTLTSEDKAIYIYTDYDTIDGEDIPALKIGDGTTYVVDLPFTAANGITAEKISAWDNKVSAEVIGDTLRLY